MSKPNPQPGFPTCRHIKTDGIQCGSPALSGRHFCYYHTLSRQRNKPNRHTPKTLHAPMIDSDDHFHQVEVMDPFSKRYTLGLLDDAAALQVAISTVVNALADNRIDITRASTLLYGLQLATTNLRNLEEDRARTPNPPPAPTPEPLTTAAQPVPASTPNPPRTAYTAGTYAQVPQKEELGPSPEM